MDGLEVSFSGILANTGKFKDGSEALAYFVDSVNEMNGRPLLKILPAGEQPAGSIHPLKMGLKNYPSLEFTPYVADLSESEKEILNQSLEILSGLLEGIDSRQVIAAYRFTNNLEPLAKNDFADSQSEIKDQNIQMHQAIRASNIGLWDWYIKPNVIFFSPEWKRQLGYEVDEISNDIKEWEDRLHPDDRQKATEYVNSFLKKPFPYYETEFRLRHKDGSYRWILSRAEAYLDENGLPERMTGCHIDITDRKLAENELRQANEFSEKIIEMAPLAFVLLDKNGNIQRLNSAAEKMFDWTKEDIQAMSLLGIHSRSTDKFHEVLLEIIEKNGIHDYNIQHERKDGTPIEVSLSAAPIIGSSDEITGIIVILADITEQKRREFELRESESRFRRLYERAPNGYQSLDGEGRICEVNHAWLENLGYLKDEVIGHHFSEFLTPASCEKFTRGFEQIKKMDEVHNLEFEMLQKSGTVVRMEFDGRIGLDDQGKFEQVHCLLSNVTEKYKADLHMRRQVERLSSLRTISNAINASLNLRLVMSVFLEQVVVQLGVDAADVMLQNSFSKKLEFAAGRGFRQKNPGDYPVYVGDGVAGQVALDRKMIQIQDLGRASGLRRRQLVDVENFVFYVGVPLISKGEIKGVLEIFHRSPFQPDQEWIEFLENLANQAAIAIDNAGLFENLQYSNIELTRAYEATIEGWSRALDLRDRDTEGHTQRVAEAAVRLAQAYGVNQADLIHIRRGALLHDIGKVGIPDRILLKPGPLTEEEWEVMKQHPVLAFELLAPISFLRSSIDIPYCHHEKWDGTGYPRGLKGDTIPLSARIFSILDVWDALRSDRPYRKGWPKEEVEDYLRGQSGKQFEPKILEVFLHVLKNEHLDIVLDGHQ
jgi:PAS domain S-box-containing protein/putative nucleotidyltransferase with HDIG domain